MATTAQIVANRSNSQLSPGPRTPEGKSASAANSFKHGLYAKSVVIPGEDPADYEQHAAGYWLRFVPGTPEEEFQVETLVEESWKRRRYSRIEAALMTRIIENAGPSDNPLGIVFSAENPDSRLLERIIRAREACTRAWDRAFRRLQDLLATRPSHPVDCPAPPEPTRPLAPSPAKTAEPPKAEPPQPAIGFVPENAPVPFLLRNVSQEIRPDMSKEERERILALRL
jgi:hypothetical protein